MKSLFTITLVLILCVTIHAQSRHPKKIIISGVVTTDEPVTAPIEHATVWIQGTRVGCVTDKNGHYSIDVTSINDTAKTYNICAMCISCHDKCNAIKKLKKSVTIDLELKPDAIELQQKGKAINSP